MEEEKKRHFFLNLLIIFILLLIGLYLYARFYEPRNLKVKEYRISSKELPTSFSGIKIVHISDIYFGNTTHIENLDKVVEKINILKPDLVLFTGNLFGNNIKKAESVTKSLSKIDSTLGKYAVKGNKDYVLEFDTIMESSGFKILKNEYELIYNEGLTPIFICGLNSSLKEEVNLNNCLNYYKDKVEDLYTPKYKIFMVHEGDTSNKILDSDIEVNLILSGNSLNGTINIPYYGPLIIPKGSKEYFSPHYKRENTEIYISSGIGTDKYPYRLFNPSSFNLYRLKSLQ